MSAESVINQLTQEASSRSAKLISDAKSYSDQAISSSFLAFGAFPDRKVDATFIPLNPEQFNPNVDLKDTYLQRFNVLNEQLNKILPGKFNEFMTLAFGGCWDKTYSKLCTAIEKNGEFLQTGEEIKLRQEIRDRANESILPAISSNMLSAAAQGHRVPPDWTWGANADAYNTAAKEIAQGDRDLTIKLIQMRLDWLDKCITHITDMRMKAINACLQYMEQVYQSASAADRNATGYISGYKTMYDNLNSYYSAVNSINDLRYRVAAKNADLGIRATEISTNATVEALKTRANVAAEMAKASGTLAGSVSAGMSTLAGITNNTNNEK